MRWQGIKTIIPAHLVGGHAINKAAHGSATTLHMGLICNAEKERANRDQ